jgi:hypothetical protein
MEKSTRYFCIDKIKSNGTVIKLERSTKNKDCIGRYKGKTPMMAAKKVATRTFREKKGISRKVLQITISEVTQGSKKKKYTYLLKKQMFKEPQGPFGSKFKIISVKK